MLKSKISIAITLALATVAVTADDIEHHPDSDEVIVVLGKVPRPVTDVVGSTTVISKEDIDKELIHDISDLVRYQTGIDIENSGSRFGYSGFSIRGISGNRVTTEIDGIPVADQFDVGSYSNSGRNFIDTDLIQQVEILRGPASSIYGSDAIGGVVSFVTKKPIDLLSQTDDDTYVSTKLGYYGVDNSSLMSVDSAFGSDTSNALVSFSLRNGEELENQADEGAGLDTQDNESRSFLAKYYVSLSENHDLLFSYDSFVRESDTVIGSYIGTGRFRSTTALSGDDESKRENLSVNYEFVLDNDWLEGGVIRLYQQTSETEQLTDERRFSRGTNYRYDRDFYYDQDVTGLRLNFYASPTTASAEHTIGYGLEWSETKTTELRDSVQTNLDAGTSTSVVLSEQFPLRDFPISKVTEYGIYFNDEIQFKDSPWSTVLAVRYDSYELTPEPDAVYLQNNSLSDVHSIDEDSVTPKVGVIYQASDNSQFYAQYIRGFRAPPFEDVNIGLFIPMFNMRALPNPDLKSEKSDGFEIGYNATGDNYKLDIAAYNNDYEDFIQTKKNLGFNPALGLILFQSQNIDEARIYGLELNYQYQTEGWFTDNDTVTATFGLNISKGNNKDTDEPLNSIHPDKMLLGVQWQSPDTKWTVALHSTVVTAKDDLDESAGELFKTAGYATFDLISNYQISEDVSLSFAINNLGDRKYWKWSDVSEMLIDDPILESLSAPGINGSVQLKVQW